MAIIDEDDIIRSIARHIDNFNHMYAHAICAVIEDDDWTKIYLKRNNIRYKLFKMFFHRNEEDGVTVLDELNDRGYNAKSKSELRKILKGIMCGYGFKRMLATALIEDRHLTSGIRREEHSGFIHPKWISVDETMPRHREDILFVMKRNDGFVRVYSGYYTEEYGCFAASGSQFHEDYFQGMVTHWLPLPMPPCEYKGKITCKLTP